MICVVSCSYLKEFRVEQCQSFLQHKCNQHRPFICFNWHFMNQRRRRPVRKRDGTFNYSADNYCVKYDETTGVCPDGDEWVFFLMYNSFDTKKGKISIVCSVFFIVTYILVSFFWRKSVNWKFSLVVWVRKEVYWGLCCFSWPVFCKQYLLFIFIYRQFVVTYYYNESFIN